jgi:hypothetical protein
VSGDQGHYKDCGGGGGDGDGDDDDDDDDDSAVSNRVQVRDWLDQWARHIRLFLLSLKMELELTSEIFWLFKNLDDR